MASIRKRGERWQARITRKGFPPEVKSFETRTGAEQWARSIESEMDRGVYVSRSPAEQISFSEILDLYMKEVSPTHKGYLTEIAKLKAVQRLRMGQMMLANVTPKVMAEYRDERLKTCKANTVIRDLAALSSVFNYCIKEWRYAIVNPVMAIRKPTMPPGRNRVLEMEEEARLLEAMRPVRNRNIYMRPLVIVALETAMRRGELLGLEWRNVDLIKRTAFLPDTKNGTSRTVPLSERAVNELAVLPRSIGGLVFPIKWPAMEYCFQRAIKRAGLVNLHFHDLRHTATTRLSEKLPNLIELAAVTGHKNVQMLARYYHPKAEDLARKIG
ncbi:site-specific integrase [Methylophilus sp. DW102]|uniref:tyrosine-type recombinase/integrase n=1 Tax=Methylophilus sp. DW102 TaxID=3095607 RepID=UPI0030913E86|nr:site-specific integrase [Methylophilus sp. DW102]